MTRPRSSAQVVRGYDELAPHALAVAALLEVVDAPATARWRPLLTWLEYNPEQIPWAILMWRDGRLVAAALLVRRRVGVVTQISTMGEDHLPSCLPVVDPDSAAELASALAEELRAIRGPWMLQLNTLEVDDPVALHLERELDRVHRDHEELAPRLAFAAGAPLNTYLSRNTRSAEAKARNRIKNAGLVMDLAWTADRAGIQAAIPEVVELQRRRNLQMNQSALLEDDSYRAFYTAMMQAYAADGLARLLTLRLDGSLAAYAMCLVSHGTLFAYSNRISPDWDHFSPGLIANAEVIRTGYEDPQITAIDWGAGIQRYKLSGGAVLHPYLSIQAYSGSFSQLARHGLERANQIRRHVGVG